MTTTTMLAQNTQPLIQRLAAANPELEIQTDAEELHRYGQDWTRFHRPNPRAIVFPRSRHAVQDIVRFARSEKVSLVPSGGRTGLSGGALATNGELVVSFDRMNAIGQFDPIDRTVVCGPGVVTETLQSYSRERDLFYPVDFAASGSSQIGGNIATNAGGINVLRYGMTRSWVAGLKVITGTGELLDLNKGLVKNNAGYDLRQLIIGSEGTLGLVVEATMRLTSPPKHRRVLLVGAPSMKAVLKVLETFQSAVVLNAFEFLSEAAMAKVVDFAGVQRPLSGASPFYAIIDLECPDEQSESLIMTLFEKCVGEELIDDGVMSQNRLQAANLWRCREEISATISRWTPYKNDISVRVSRAPDFLQEIDEVVARHYPNFEVIWYGHMGDGNLHLNILKPDDITPSDFLAQCEKVNEWVYGVVQKHEGSVSAEHGIGMLKKNALRYSRSKEEVRLMKAIKAVFDPDGILNPGKIFD